MAAGYYRFGVRSDDGFIVEIGTPPAGLFTAVAVGSYDGGRGSGESVFDFYAPVAGIYCTRLIYFEGGGGADCEFYSIKADGTRILINDPGNAEAIVSYRVNTASQPPYVIEAFPAPGATDVKLDVTISANIADGTTVIEP